MKNVLMIGLCLIVAGMIGCSQEVEASGLSCDSHFGKYILNECASHPTVKDKMQVGIGVDIPLYKSEKLIVDQETKIDLNKGDFGDFKKSNIGTYTVFKPQLDKGILQIALAKLKGFFDKE